MDNVANKVALDNLRALNLPTVFEAAGFPQMSHVLKPFDRDTIRIEHYEVSPVTAVGLAMRAMQRSNVRDYTPPGTYTRMVVKLPETDPDYDEDRDGWVVMMSDTLAERVETRQLLNTARGHVLVAGLGLGMLVHALLERPDIDSVTVLEVNPLVIQAVGPTLAEYGPAVRVIEADARTWEPGDNRVPDTVLLDIWPVIGETMHRELAEMREHYARLFPAARIEGWLERELALSERLWAVVEDACRDATKAKAIFDVRRGFGMFSTRFHEAIETAQVVDLLRRAP